MRNHLNELMVISCLPHYLPPPPLLRIPCTACDICCFKWIPSIPSQNVEHESEESGSCHWHHSINPLKSASLEQLDLRISPPFPHSTTLHPTPPHPTTLHPTPPHHGISTR